MSQHQSSMYLRGIRLPKKNRVLQRKKAEQGQGVMNQLKAEVQSQQAAEKGSESTQ